MIKNGDDILKVSRHQLEDYTYEKYNSKADPKKESSGKPKEMTEEKKQEIVTKMLAAAGRPNGANRPYGTGETLASAGVAALRVGEMKAEGDNGYFTGQTVFLEARARTYQTRTGFGAEAQASLMRAEYGGKGSVSLIETRGAEIVGAGAYGKGELFVGAQANAQAGAGFKGPIPFAGASVAAFAGARVGIGAGAELRILGVGARVDGKAYAWAGAQGTAEASISPAGLKAEAAGFAGAAAGVEGTASIGGIGVTGTAEAYAGAGGKAGIGVGLTDDGDIVVKAELGGAVGVGAGAGLEVSIDTDQLISDAEAAWGNIDKLTDGFGQGASQALRGTGFAAAGAAGALNNLGQAVAEAAGNAAETAGDAAEDVVDTVTETAGNVGNAVGEAAGAAADTAGNAAEAVTDFLGW